MRELWRVDWQVITPDWIMADTELVWAYDREDALDKFTMIEDIPADAEVITCEIA